MLPSIMATMWAGIISLASITMSTCCGNVLHVYKTILFTNTWLVTYSTHHPRDWACLLWADAFWKYLSSGLHLTHKHTSLGHKQRTSCYWTQHSTIQLPTTEWFADNLSLEGGMQQQWCCDKSGNLSENLHMLIWQLKPTLKHCQHITSDMLLFSKMTSHPASHRPKIQPSQTALIK